MQKTPRTLLALSLVLILILGITVILLTRQGSYGIRVSPANVPPAVVATMNQSNGPVRVFPGLSGAFVILPDRSLWGWGQTQRGTSESRALKPQKLGNNCEWIQHISTATSSFGVVLRHDGTLSDWKARPDLAISGSDFTNSAGASIPNHVFDPGHDWVEISAGATHAAALKRDGTLWMWGGNASSQLGNGPGPNQASPVQVGTRHDWMAVSCAQQGRTYAVRQDGTLWVWGQAWWGHSVVDWPFPSLVCRDTNWAGFENGSGMVLARTRSGEVWHPLLSPAEPSEPATSSCLLVGSNSVAGHFARAFCGEDRLYEARPDGTLWQKPFFLDRSGAPVEGAWLRVGGRSDWVSLWSRAGTALGLTSDGTLWMWGIDAGQPPAPDLRSKITKLKVQIMAWIGRPVPSYQISLEDVYQEEPRSLMRFAMADAKRE